ncbi:MAG: hypothetical protein R3E32_12880 [Chitinophagales bacterium]
MSNFTKTFKLKQHTPLIHFQHEQVGAGIRATELKPKLDRFLIKEVFNNQFDRYKHLLVGFNGTQSQKDFDGKEAFDYKVKINCQSKKVEEIEKQSTDKWGNTKWNQHPLFFGNMGVEGTEERKCFVWCEGVEIEFFSLKKELLETLSERFAYFIATHNFGTRQTKGFGSFYIDPKDKENHKPFLNVLREDTNAFVFFQRDMEKQQSVYSDIDMIYKLMKGGINFDFKNSSNFIYHKGFIFKYFLNKKIGNEKRLIKEKLFPRALKVPQNDRLEKKYVRAVLGINESVEFKDKENNRNGIVKYTHKEVERFASPIFFKIVGKYVVIIPKSANAILNIDSDFKLSVGNLSEDIKTPDATDFNTEDFLFEFATYFNELASKYFGEDSNYKEYTIEDIDENLMDDYDSNKLRVTVMKQFVHSLECSLTKFKKQ